MNLEIEHKFLLKRLPKLSFYGKKNIVQYYVWSNQKNDFDRYRCSEHDGLYKYYHTYKVRITDEIREEYEEEISKEEFYSLCLDKTSNKCIKKTRYLFKYDNLIWEVDDFSPSNINLIIAEVELPNENLEYKIPIDIKDEIIMNVTKFPEFLNLKLAEKICS